MARIDITPESLVPLAGYPSRTHLSTGVTQRLSAKALAIEDAAGNRVVIVTVDLLGLPRSIADPASTRVQQRYGLNRSQLLFNASSTHSAPAIHGAYARRLADSLFSVVGASLANLAPAGIAFAQGIAALSVNDDHPAGPVEHSVPVLRITSADGKLRAVVVGYACRAMALDAETYEVDADYPGYAQARLEAAHPGATALFLMLCGGDQTPELRGTAAARQLGAALAEEVERVMDGRMTPLSGPLRSALQITDLPLGLPEYQQQERGSRQRFEQLPFPVQAIRFGRGLTIFALGGDAPVEYALRVHREFSRSDVIVAGYSNDIAPRIVDSDLQGRILAAVSSVARRVGLRPR